MKKKKYLGIAVILVVVLAGIVWYLTRANSNSNSIDIAEKDFIKFGGKYYVNEDIAFSNTDVDEKIGIVESNTPKESCKWTPQDNEASRLKIGTEIYSVKDPRLTGIAAKYGVEYFYYAEVSEDEFFAADSSKEEKSKWDCSVNCAEESTADSYIVTYSEEEISSNTGILTFQNQNKFEITVHLITAGEEEEVFEIQPGGCTTFYQLEKDTVYTVGVHAEVNEGMEIRLVVYDGEWSEVYASAPKIVIDGKEYFAYTMSIVNELPEGYECAGELTEEQLKYAHIDGTKYYINKQEENLNDFYVYQECGTPIDEKTVDSTKRQWAYVKWSLVE